MKRVLVSGFESFEGVSDNPTGTIVRAMQQRGAGDEGVRFAVLPVTWGGAAKVLLARADREGVDGCLMFGVAAGDSALRVERCAWNEADAAIPDNAGVRKQGERLSSRGEARVDTDFPVEALAERLRAARIPAAVSDDPGRYICNALYYNALTAGRAWSKWSLFVHVPQASDGPGGVTLHEIEHWMALALAGYVALLATTEGGRGR